MQETINYKLKKPDGEDFYNVDDFNYNADKIDEIINTEVDGLDQKINNLNDSVDFAMKIFPTRFLIKLRKDKWNDSDENEDYPFEQILHITGEYLSVYKLFSSEIRAYPELLIPGSTSVRNHIAPFCDYNEATQILKVFANERLAIDVQATLILTGVRK